MRLFKIGLYILAFKYYSVNQYNEYDCLLMHVFYLILNPTKWTHFGSVSAIVGVTLLHNFKNIVNW